MSPILAGGLLIGGGEEGMLRIAFVAAFSCPFSFTFDHLTREKQFDSIKKQ